MTKCLLSISRWEMTSSDCRKYGPPSRNFGLLCFFEILYKLNKARVWNSWCESTFGVLFDSARWRGAEYKWN
jgi:hypothetical protein